MVPPVPQCWLLLVWQTPFWQQPLGQLAGVHTQLPAWHSSPAAHWTQVRPLLPQAWFVLPAWQSPLASQQPRGQLAVVHTQLPFLHSVPAGQLMQTTPLVPQAVLVLPALHSPFSQQPLEQLVGVHTHVPF